VVLSPTLMRLALLQAAVRNDRLFVKTGNVYAQKDGAVKMERHAFLPLKTVKYAVESLTTRQRASSLPAPNPQTLCAKIGNVFVRKDGAVLTARLALRPQVVTGNVGTLQMMRQLARSRNVIHQGMLCVTTGNAFVHQEPAVETARPVLAMDRRTFLR